MMSSEKTNLFKLVKKQTVFKLKAFYSFFTVLLFIQMIAMFFSYFGTMTYGSTVEYVSIEVSFFSADAVIVFSLLWAFITSILLTTKAYRYSDFTFVTNRLTSNFSNILFLLFASLVAGVTAFLSRYLIRVIQFYTTDVFIVQPFVEPASEIIIGISATVLYVLLFCAIGYFSGMLVQMHRLFLVLLPVLYLGVLIISDNLSNGSVNPVFGFFGLESSFFMFVVKVLLIVVILFGSATGLTNRLEVK